MGCGEDPTNPNIFLFFDRYVIVSSLRRNWNGGSVVKSIKA